MNPSSVISRILLCSFAALLMYSCKQEIVTVIPAWEAYDESEDLVMNQGHENPRMKYKLIQSQVQDKNEIWKDIQPQIQYFSEDDYVALKPLIYEQDILTIQAHVEDGKLSYEKITQWYLYRIAKYENDPTTTLHTILAVNVDAVEEAKAYDKSRTGTEHPIFGLPVLLKDNINTEGMNTTAGAIALKDNVTDDAFIVQRLKEKGAIILGKVNLSEWAYFFCGGCPVGYSAIGGQTLNPYGRKVFETGGSSAGSGTSMAANYAVAAIGTETSGSILSPSSKNSVVGLKPTIGLASRGGIVPISSTLDTPGPMTRSVIDNAIVMSAIIGKDEKDDYTRISMEENEYWKGLENASLDGVRLGANRNFLEDSLYRIAVETLRSAGAEVVEFEPIQSRLNGFVSILNIDMKYDLPKYLKEHAGNAVTVKSITDVIDFNLQDTLVYAPYGQVRLEGAVEDTVTQSQLKEIIKDCMATGRSLFDTPMKEYNLDAILSINNYNAGQAAAAHYPALTVPMGYEEDGEPKNLTFIAEGSSEEKLYRIAYAYEQASKLRKAPELFK